METIFNFLKPKEPPYLWLEAEKKVENATLPKLRKWLVEVSKIETTEMDLNRWLNARLVDEIQKRENFPHKYYFFKTALNSEDYSGEPIYRTKGEALKVVRALNDYIELIIYEVNDLELDNFLKERKGHDKEYWGS